MNPSNLSDRSADVNWFVGVVENRNDPAKLGRVQVRIAGYHVHDLGILPTSSLPWAQIVMPAFGPMNGVGWSPTGIVEGAWVVGFFLDGRDAQFPVIWGALPGIPTQARDPNSGFCDTRNSATGFPKPVTAVTKPGTFTEGTAPLYPTTLDKPDVSPFARAEDVVNLKSGMTEPSISVPSNPYAAQYPFNHTFQTESGHLMEFDDTPGAERINIWHRSGAYTEFHPNGARVGRAANIYDLAYGSHNTWASGDIKQTAGANIDLTATTNFNLTALQNTLTTTAGATLLMDANITLTAPLITLAGPSIVTGMFTFAGGITAVSGMTSFAGVSGSFNTSDINRVITVTNGIITNIT